MKVAILKLSLSTNFHKFLTQFDLIRFVLIKNVDLYVVVFFSNFVIFSSTIYVELRYLRVNHHAVAPRTRHWRRKDDSEELSAFITRAHQKAVHFRASNNCLLTRATSLSIYLEEETHQRFRALFVSTMVQNSQGSRLQYCTCFSICPFARTAPSIACSTQLASLARSAALTRSLARSLCSLPRLWESELLDCFFFCFLFYFGR